MEFSYDTTKDAANIAKHGVSLARAADFEWDSAVVWPDRRRDYGEPRRPPSAISSYACITWPLWIAPTAGARPTSER
ncbi:MAG: BrnT family toxin [Rhodocyclaceae bacterium]|nr:BrnT family toxin [Rhodocyclaceae bacterium]